MEKFKSNRSRVHNGHNLSGIVDVLVASVLGACFQCKIKMDPLRFTTRWSQNMSFTRFTRAGGGQDLQYHCHANFPSMEEQGLRWHSRGSKPRQVGGAGGQACGLSLKVQLLLRGRMGRYWQGHDVSRCAPRIDGSFLSLFSHFSLAYSWQFAYACTNCSHARQARRAHWYVTAPIRTTWRAVDALAFISFEFLRYVSQLERVFHCSCNIVVIKHALQGSLFGLQLHASHANLQSFRAQPSLMGSSEHHAGAASLWFSKPERVHKM